MKILHICNDYRNNGLYSIMFKKLSDLGANQSVFVPFKKELLIDKNKDFEITHLSCYNNFDRMFFYRKARKIYNSLNRTMKSNIREFEIVHAHTMFSNGIVANKIKEDYGIEYVVSVRSTDIEIFYKKLVWLRKVGIKILLEAKKIIFLSASIQNNLLSLIQDNKLKEVIKKRSTIISNGIDDFWFNNLNKKYKCVKPIIISQVGWIKSNKNQLNSFKAIEILNELGMECNLKIIGGVEYKKDGKYYEKLVDYISKSKYKDNVEFIKRQGKEELINSYRNSDIFLMPSFKETFGLVYIEALSQGLPIIYSNNQGVDGLFKGDSVGANVNPKNPTDIAQGIESVVKRYNQLSKNIDIHLSRFRWDNIVTKIFDIYRQ